MTKFLDFLMTNPHIAILIIYLSYTAFDFNVLVRHRRDASSAQRGFFTAVYIMCPFAFAAAVIALAHAWDFPAMVEAGIIFAVAFFLVAVGLINDLQQALKPLAIAIINAIFAVVFTVYIAAVMPYVVHYIKAVFSL